jgi:hypothetical protein
VTPEEQNESVIRTETQVKDLERRITIAERRLSDKVSKAEFEPTRRMQWGMVLVLLAMLGDAVIKFTGGG